MLRLTIEPAGPPESLDGVPVRPWKGSDRDGNEYLVFVHRIASDEPRGQAKLAAVLSEKTAPATMPLAELAALCEKMRRAQKDACSPAAYLTAQDAAAARSCERTVDDALARLSGGGKEK